MALDIDSFLDNVNKDEVNQPQDKKVEKRVDLDFQKDVEKNLDTIKKDALDKDSNILKEIYEEVRNFNVDLPNKFLGVESKSGLTLKDLGEK